MLADASSNKSLFLVESRAKSYQPPCKPEWKRFFELLHCFVYGASNQGLALKQLQGKKKTTPTPREESHP